MLNLATLYV